VTHSLWPFRGVRGTRADREGHTWSGMSKSNASTRHRGPLDDQDDDERLRPRHARRRARGPGPARPPVRGGEVTRLQQPVAAAARLGSAEELHGVPRNAEDRRSAGWLPAVLAGAPEGIRTPNLLIRRIPDSPTPPAAMRPFTSPETHVSAVQPAYVGSRTALSGSVASLRNRDADQVIGTVSGPPRDSGSARGPGTVERFRPTW
jgi:hypothetical protein